MQEQVAQREEVRLALVKLSVEQRRVIALRYGADLTELDIAQVLGWPVGTVKSRLSNAFTRLRLLLGNYVLGQDGPSLPEAIGETYR